MRGVLLSMLLNFPDCEILMCYFHVVDNIRKHKNLIKSEKYEELKSDINEIHNEIEIQMKKNIMKC